MLELIQVWSLWHDSQQRIPGGRMEDHLKNRLSRNLREKRLRENLFQKHNRVYVLQKYKHEKFKLKYSCISKSAASRHGKEFLTAILHWRHSWILGAVWASKYKKDINRLEKMSSIGHQDSQGLEHKMYEGRLRELGSFSMGRRQQKGILPLPRAT